MQVHRTLKARMDPYPAGSVVRHVNNIGLYQVSQLSAAKSRIQLPVRSFQVLDSFPVVQSLQKHPDLLMFTTGKNCVEHRRSFDDNMYRILNFSTKTWLKF